MSERLYLLTICIPLAVIVIVFGMKYFSAAMAARARLANDAAYRTLAEKMSAAQAENQASLARIQAELSTLNASLATVEKILKQVE
jgi:hypothetical protein